MAGSGKEHNRKPERAHRERSGCSAFKRTAPAKAGGRDRSGGNRLAVALIVEEGEPVRENTYGSSAYSIPRSHIADLMRTADGVVVSFRTRGDKRERWVPLSRPEDATPVIISVTLYRMLLR